MSLDFEDTRNIEVLNARKNLILCLRDSLKYQELSTEEFLVEVKKISDFVEGTSK